MSQWVERIRNHQVFSELDTFEKVLEAAKESCLADPTCIDHWDRANAVIKHIKMMLRDADPLLVVSDHLSHLSTYLQQARSEVSNFSANKNVGHWTNAHAALDNSLSQAATISHRSVSSASALKESAADYREVVGGWMDKMKNDYDGISALQQALEGRITETTNEVDTQKQRLDTAIATFQQQFSDAQQNRQTEFSTSENNRAQLATNNEKKRQAVFEKKQEERDERAEEAAALATAGHGQLIRDLTDNSKSTLDELAELKAHAQKIVGIISDTGMAHGYQKTANQERYRSIAWSVVAALSLIAWIFFGIRFFYLTYDQTLTWYAIARQILISTPFILLSGFAAMQVSLHQKNEQRLRQAELEIASLDPFLATLDDKERNEVKKEFASRYFGQREVEAKNESAEPKLIDVLDSLVKTLHEMQRGASR